MASKIITQADEIIKTKGFIEEKTEQYKLTYEKINKLIDEIFSNEQWGGAEARAFNEKLQGFQNDFRDMHRKLTDYCNFLRKAADAYTTAQDGVTARADKLSADR